MVPCNPQAKSRDIKVDNKGVVTVPDATRTEVKTAADLLSIIK